MWRAPASIYIAWVKGQEGRGTLQRNSQYGSYLLVLGVGCWDQRPETWLWPGGDTHYSGFMMASSLR